LRDRLVIECQASDQELLFADWLDSLIYAMATQKMPFAKFLVQLDGNRLHAQVWGEPIDVERHRPTAEIKGATSTGLRAASPFAVRHCVESLKKRRWPTKTCRQWSRQPMSWDWRV
jgi:hypothetical protein